MPAPVLVGSNNANNSTVTLPTGIQANDRIVLFAAQNSNGPFTTTSLSGWTIHENSSSGSSGYTICRMVATKIASGSESGQSLNVGLTAVYVVQVWRNVDSIQSQIGTTAPLVGETHSPPQIEIPGSYTASGSGSVHLLLPTTFVPGFGTYWYGSRGFASSGDYTKNNEQQLGAGSVSIMHKAYAPGTSITQKVVQWLPFGNPDNGQLDPQQTGYAASFALVGTNAAPNTPTSLSPSGAQGVNAVTLSATVSDSNGDNCNAEFQLALDSGFTQIVEGSATGSTVASGGTSTASRTLTANTTYWVRARTIDVYGLTSGYTAGQSFITNRPPAAVAVTAPNGGEVWNASHTITWTGGSDPDSQATTADIELSTNGGTNWSVIVTATPNDGSHVYDFSAVAASTACKIRIRSKDTQGVYGTYDESNANFTIQHNQAPTAPTLLAPANSSAIDLAAGYGFDWTRNDPDAGDTQTAFYMRRKIAGAGSYEYWNATSGAWQGTEVKNTSGTDAYTFVAGKWTNGNTYNWSVATEDSQGLKGPYATDFTVVASAGATVSVTTPLSPVTDTSKPMVTWTLSDPESDPQQTYQVSVFTVAQTAVGGFDPASSPNTWGTGEVADETARNRQVLTDLANGTTYRAYVRCKTNAQYSAWVYREFSLSLTPPASPTLTVTYDEVLNRMELIIDGQHNTASFPDVYYVAEFSDDGGATWGTVRDAGNLDGDTAQVQVVYDYEAPAWAERLYRARSVANL